MVVMSLYREPNEIHVYTNEGVDDVIIIIPARLRHRYFGFYHNWMSQTPDQYLQLVCCNSCPSKASWEQPSKAQDKRQIVLVIQRKLFSVHPCRILILVTTDQP
jgi:hypothetical protein